MIKFLAVLLAASALSVSAAADPITSYAEIQRALMSAAYKVPPMDAALSGTVADVVQSLSAENLFYIVVRVDDPDDAALWSLEDDNYFIAQLHTGGGPPPFSPGDAVTVEGSVVSLFSSPACPYIVAEKINGSGGF